MTQAKYSYIRRDAERGIPRGKVAEQYTREAPVPKRPWNIHTGDLVKIYEAEVFRGEWRLCEVVSISTHVVACRDLRTGTMTSFRIQDYLHNDGVIKVEVTE